MVGRVLSAQPETKKMLLNIGPLLPPKGHFILQSYQFSDAILVSGTVYSDRFPT